MSPFRPFARIASMFTRAFDGLTAVTVRLNDRFENHLTERTKLLRAHYARDAARLDSPLPVLDAPIDLSLRGGVKKAA